MVSDISDDLKFKRIWESAAKNAPSGVLVFGPFWGPRYSRSWDVRDFGDAEKLLQMNSSDCILDVGCGPLARAEVYFGRRGFRVVGVDVSTIIASQAETTLRKFRVKKTVDLVVADAESLPFREESFEKILATGLVVHLPTRNSVVRALQQFRFIMKKNGRCFIIWLPNLYSIFGPLFKFVTRIGFIGKRERIQFLNFKGVKEIRQICAQAGLTISQIFHNSILWYGFYLFPKFTHKYIEKIVSIQNETNRRHPTTSFLPYSFNIMAKRRTACARLH